MYHHKWLYHETLAPAGRMFKSDAEEAAAGEGWVDTPAKFGCNAPKRIVPTLDEVLKAGYNPRAAARIVAREQALADGKSEEEADAAADLAGEAYDAANPPVMTSGIEPPSDVPDPANEPADGAPPAAAPAPRRPRR